MGTNKIWELTYVILGRCSNTSLFASLVDEVANLDDLHLLFNNKIFPKDQKTASRTKKTQNISLKYIEERFRVLIIYSAYNNYSAGASADAYSMQHTFF